MSAKPILYGFSPSTYVRTARMVLADHDVDYDQVPVNVLEGEPRQPEHLARHPFGKVPVLDIDGMRLRETSAICRYIDETREGPSCIPADAKARAKMNEAISVFDSYAYSALLGLVGYHLFPDLIGGANDEAHAASFESSKKAISLLMEQASPWIVGDRPTLADYFLAPIMFYVGLTPEEERVRALPGVDAWWQAMAALPVFEATTPDLG